MPDAASLRSRPAFDDWRLKTGASLGAFSDRNQVLFDLNIKSSKHFGLQDVRDTARQQIAGQPCRRCTIHAPPRGLQLICAHCLKRGHQNC